MTPERTLHHLLPLALMLALAGGCAPDDGADPRVGALGTVEVTARLVDVPGEFPSNELYDYAYVMKYEVVAAHRGDVAGTFLVGHYNPLKRRAVAADERSGTLGGNLTRFRVGDLHRLALEVPIEEYCMAGIVNLYAESEPGSAPVYWAVWANRVVP